MNCDQWLIILKITFILDQSLSSFNQAVNQFNNFLGLIKQIIKHLYIYETQIFH